MHQLDADLRTATTVEPSSIKHAFRTDEAMCDKVVYDGETYKDDELIIDLYNKSRVVNDDDEEQEEHDPNYLDGVENRLDWVPTDEKDVSFAEIVRKKYEEHERVTVKSGKGSKQESEESLMVDGRAVMKKKMFLRALLDFNGVLGNEKANMGVKMLKSNTLEDVPEEARKALVRFSRSIIRKLMATLLPRYGKELMKAVLKHIGLLNDEK